MISENLSQIQNTISECENAHQRTPDSVQLLAVSKRKPIELILEAVAAGHTSFGENYADEGALKIQALKEHKLNWHYIGHIQSNKTRLISGHYNWVQSVDRMKIAERLALHRPTDLGPLNICLQVNIDAEQSKSGCTPEELPELADFISQQSTLTLRGLMAIPTPTEDPEKQKAAFRELAVLYRTMQQRHSGVDTLSMGMSGDMEAAIAEGATMVRIGTAIFGRRD